MDINTAEITTIK